MARRGYPSPRGRTADERKRDDLNRRARESRTGGSSDTSTELREALNNPVQQPGLTLSVQAVPFKSGDFGTVLSLPKDLDPIDTVVVLELEGKAR